MAKSRKFKRPAPAFSASAKKGSRRPAVKPDGNKPIELKKQNAGQFGSLAESNSESIDPSQRHQKRLKPASSRLDGEAFIRLQMPEDNNYALLDCGDGLKLEQFGRYKIIRPEGQAIWQKSMADHHWRDVDAVFTGNTDEEGLGRWRFDKKPLQETWPMNWQGLSYLGRFTSFRHVGVFPEQAAHWQYIETELKKYPKPKFLNLFGYTGLASLVAARAGAQVTHIDASKKAIGWSRENETASELENPQIRWICDDAVKFCQREIRRGNTYDAIILDPPAYGRGPKGETWQFFEDIAYMLDLTKQMLSKKPAFVILTAYTIRASSLAMHELMQEVFGDLGGRLDSGELVIGQKNSARALSTSMFSRWTAQQEKQK